jgi:hypothetical protein
MTVDSVDWPSLHGRRFIIRRNGREIASIETDENLPCPNLTRTALETVFAAAYLRDGGRTLMLLADWPDIEAVAADLWQLAGEILAECDEDRDWLAEYADRLEALAAQLSPVKDPT